MFLNSRQTQVLSLAAQGLNDTAIALRLGIARRTVRAHMQAACGALGAVNRTNAVAIALVRRLINLDTVTAN